jgi:hypothetical protein
MPDDDAPPFPPKIEVLGKCLRESSHGPRTESSLLPPLVAIVLGVLGVGLILLGGYGLLFATEGRWHGIVLIAIGCSLIPAGAGYYATASGKARSVRSGRRFGMFEKGIVYVDGDGPIPATWEDVRLAIFVQDDGFVATSTRRTRVIKIQTPLGLIVLDDDLETEGMWWELAHHMEGKCTFQRAS